MIGAGIAAWVWLQATPDIRDVSWWLPHGAIRDLIWTVVLAVNLAALVWILYKLLFRGASFSIPQALRDRGRGIQERIGAAERSHQEAEARLAAIETRLAGLPAELTALQRDAEAEAEGEYQRLLEASRRDADRILKQGKQEIEAAAKLAQKELTGLAAALAVDLATARIREHLTPEQDEAVVRAALAGFELDRPN